MSEIISHIKCGHKQRHRQAITFSSDSVLMEMKDAQAEELDQMLKNDSAMQALLQYIDEWGARVD